MTLLPLAAAPPPPRLKTPLVLEEFFTGRIMARGVFTPTFGGAVRGLSVIIDCSWDGRTLSLAEEFAYDDGERDTKTWRFTRIGPRRYDGTREDVVGKADAWPDGVAMRLAYQVILKTEAYGDLKVRFRDIMALEPDGTLLNRAVVSKWGIRLGRVELRMMRAAG